MRRIILIILMSLLLTSCSNGLPESNQKFVLEDNENFIFNKISFTAEKEYRIDSIKWFDDNHLFVILRNVNRSPSEKIYLLDLMNNSSSCVYEGNFEGGSWNIQTKHYKDTIMLKGLNKILIFDTMTKQVLDTIDFPPGSYEGDISYDLQFNAYINEEGLFISDKNSSTRKKIASTDRESKIAPAFPLWSPNYNMLMYLIYSEGSNIINIVTEDGTEVLQHRFLEGWLSYWFLNENKIAAFGGSQLTGTNAILKIIDVDTNEVVDIEKEGGVNIDSPPINNTILYEQTITMDNEIKIKKQLMMMDLNNNSDIPVTPLLEDVRSSSFSPSGEAIAFLASIEPLDTSIYICIKK